MHSLLHQPQLNAAQDSAAMSNRLCVCSTKRLDRLFSGSVLVCRLYPSSMKCCPLFPDPHPAIGILWGIDSMRFVVCCRDNILFGRAWQQERYEAVLKACALQGDVQQMRDGDTTLIGDRGVTLSGGQRARLSLARAIYQVLGLYAVCNACCPSAPSQSPPHLLQLPSSHTLCLRESSFPFDTSHQMNLHTPSSSLIQTGSHLM